MSCTRFTHFMEHLYRRHGKRTVAAVTLACFFVSSIIGPAAALPVTDRPDTQPFERLQKEFILPYTLGRITDAHYAGSRKVAIVVQDLHCHPEVQKNIAAIIASLDKRFGITNVYLEGGSGQIDTSWLLSLSDAKLRQAVIASLMAKGELTGAEYYAMTANRPRLLLGLENRKAYDGNVARLDRILEHQDDIRAAVARLKDKARSLENTYCGTKNKRLARAIDRYRGKGQDAARFYGFLRTYARKNGIDPYAYENLTGYLELLQFERELRYPKIAAELQRFLGLLKEKLPYRTYQSIVEKTDNFAKLDELYLSLARLSQSTGISRDLEREMPDLAAFFRYVSLSQQVNPLDLVREERKLIGDLRLALSGNESEREIVFLTDFLQRLEDFYTNKLSADDYRYYAEHREEFDLLWDKYADASDLRPLDRYTGLVGEYYRVNDERNAFFLQNILASGTAGSLAPTASGDDLAATLASLEEGGEAVMAVTGGFHTAGFTALLKANGISYVVITPNVTQETNYSDAVYSRTMEEQARILVQTIAPDPGGLHAQKLVTGVLDAIIADMRAAGKVPAQHAAEIGAQVQKALAESREKGEDIAPETVFTLEKIDEDDTCEFAFAPGEGAARYRHSPRTGEPPLAGPEDVSKRPVQSLGRSIKALIWRAVVTLEAIVSRTVFLDAGQTDLLNILKDESISTGDKFFYLLAGAHGEKLMTGGGEEGVTYQQQLARMSKGFKEMGFAIEPGDVNLSKQARNLLIAPDADVYALGTMRISPITNRLTVVIHRRFFQIMEMVGPLVRANEDELIDSFVDYEGMQYRALNEPRSSEYAALSEYLREVVRKKTGKELSDEELGAPARGGSTFQSFIRSLAALPERELAQKSPLHWSLAKLSTLLDFSDDAVLIDQTLRLYEQNFRGSSDAVIKGAIRIAAQRYGDKSFPSGERYMHHALTVARNAAKWGADDATIAAAILHKLSVSEVRDVFSKQGIKQYKSLGTNKAALIQDRMDKLSRISKLPYAGGMINGLRGGFTLQNYMNMLVRLAEDDQTMLLVFADRLGKLPQSADPAEKDYRRQEIEHIFVPLAMRLDAYNIAEELRNETFYRDDPETYFETMYLVEDYLGTSYEQAELMLRTFKEEIAEGLRARGIEGAVVKARVKTPYSIWEKLSSDRRKTYKGKVVSSLKDILGLQIIVDDDHFHQTMDFVNAWLADSENSFHNILPREEDEKTQAEKMKQYKARPIVPDRSQGLNRFRYNFADSKERSYELSLYGAEDYAQLQSGFLEETSIKSLKPHWIYKLGEEVRTENGVYIQKVSFKHAGGRKTSTDLSFRGDNIRTSRDFSVNFKALHDSLDGKMFVMFFDDKQRLGVVSLPEGSIPADLAAHIDIGLFGKSYNGLEKVFLAKQGENPVHEEKPRHVLAEKVGEMETGDIVMLRPKGAAAVPPSAQIVRNAKTPRAILLATLLHMTPAEKKKLAESGMRMIIKKGSGKVTDETWQELVYFRRSKGLWDSEELYLAVSQGIIETDEVTQFLKLASRRVIQLVGNEDVFTPVSGSLADLGFRVKQFTTEDYGEDRTYFKIIIEQTEPSSPAPTNGVIAKELLDLDGVEGVDVKNAQSLYLSAQALGHNVYSLLVSLYGIKTVSLFARSLGELLIKSFEKQTMRLGEIARAGYADSVQELERLVSQSPDRPVAQIIVSKNSELVRNDSWAMATMDARLRTDGLTNEKVIARATLYVHEEFLKAINNRAPPERNELLRLLVEHELAEFRALNLPNSEEYKLFTAYLRERFDAPGEHRNQDAFHELILQLKTKEKLSPLEARLAPQATLLDWATGIMELAGETVLPVTGTPAAEVRENPEIKAVDAILRRMQSGRGGRSVLKEGLVALLNLDPKTPEAWRLIKQQLGQMADRMLVEGSSNDELYNLIYAFEIVSDRFNLAPIIVPSEYERTDGPKFRALLTRLMAETGRKDLSLSERDEVDRFCKALEEIPGAIAPVVADIRYPNLCGPSAQAIGNTLAMYGIPFRKKVFSGHGFAQTCVETTVAGFKFYVDGTAGLVVTDGRQIAPVVVPHRDVLERKIGIYLSKAEGGEMDKQTVDGWFHVIDMDKDTAAFIREVRDLRYKYERASSAARLSESAGVAELIRSLPEKIFSMLRSSPVAWRQDYARLVEKYIGASDTRTRELLKRVEVYYRVLKTDDFKRKIKEIAKEVNGIPGVQGVYGLGYPFYGRIKVTYRNYTTLKDIDKGKIRLSEFAQRTLPDIDLLLVIEEDEEGPWAVREDMDSRMMEVFLRQASGLQRQWRRVFERIVPEYNVVNKFSSEADRDPIDLFLEEGKLNIDFVPVVKHVWVNMPVMVLPEDIKTFKVIRDLLFTSAPLMPLGGDRPVDVPLQFRRNFILNLMHQAGTPLKKEDIISKIIEIHPYGSLITMYAETLAHVADMFGQALADAESKGLVVRGADDTYTFTPEGEAFFAYVLKQRQTILDQGYLDLPPYNERMLPAAPAAPVTASTEKLPAESAGMALAAADPRRVLVGEAAAQTAELLTPSSPDWMRENAPEAYGKTMLRFFEDIGVDGMEETASLNTLGMNAVCVLPHAPNDDGLPVGKITVTRPDGRKNIRLIAGKIEAGDGRPFGFLYGEGLEPADTVRVAAWLKGLPEHRKREIAQLLGLRFNDIDVRIVECNGPVSHPYRGNDRLLNGISLLYRSLVVDDVHDRTQTYPGTVVPEYILPEEPDLRAMRLVNELYLPQILSRNAQSVSRAGTSLGETVMASALRSGDARKDSGIGELKDLFTYFTKKLTPAGMNVMQLLPLTLPDESSPFEAVDPRAGDYALIDCASVPEVQELVSAKDPVIEKLNAPGGEKDAVDRERVLARKYDVLRAARARLSGERETRFWEYVRKEGYWLDAYARRMAAAKMIGVPASAVTPTRVAEAETIDRKAFTGYVDTFRYMQWLFDDQLKDATARISLNGGKTYFWAAMDGQTFEESLKAINYWFAAYGFDGVRLSISDPLIAGSPEKLQRIKDTVNRVRPGAAVSLVLPEAARSIPSETFAGFGFLRVRSFTEIAQGEKIAPNEIVEMGGTKTRAHAEAAARSGNLIDFYTERLDKAREAVCVLFTLGDLFGDDRTLASPDRQGKERWNYRVPLEGEVSESRVKSSLAGLGEELSVFSAGNRTLASRRGYATAAAMFKDVIRGANERTALQQEQQFEVGTSLLQIHEPGLHAALAVYRYILAHPRLQNGLISEHAAGSDRSFFSLVVPVLQELSELPGANREYWKAALAYVTDLERQARESADRETKVRNTMEMFGFVRGMLEQVLDNEDRGINLPPADETQRAARRALLCAADSFIMTGPDANGKEDPARMLEKARLLVSLNRFGEARTALQGYAAAGRVPGYEGTRQALEFIELLNVYARRTQDNGIIPSFMGVVRDTLGRYAVNETAPLELQALYYNALKVASRYDAAFAGRAAAVKTAVERAGRPGQDTRVTSGALYLLGLSETGDLLSRAERENLMRAIEDTLVGAAGLRHEPGSQELDPSLIGLYVNARIGLFGRDAASAGIWNLVNPLLDVALQNGAIPDILPLDRAQTLSSVRPVAELLRVFDLFAKPELSSPAAIEDSFKDAVKALDIRSQKAMRGAA